jgi:hypothetical protein
MLESDGEGEGGLRFRTFRDQDMANPIFKVGILFESVEVLRAAPVYEKVEPWRSKIEP